MREPARPSTPRALLFGILTIDGLAAQDTIFRIDGESLAHALRPNVRLVGDVDRDGFPDFVTSALRAGSPPGAAQIRSGRSGIVIRVLFGLPYEDFGMVFSGAGDVDRDGHADLIVGIPSGSPATNLAAVFSGRTGSLLHLFQGRSFGGDWFGAAVDGVGDVDGDGQVDLAVGAPRARSSFSASEVGAVHVYSGRTGQLLHSLLGTGLNEWLGLNVSGAGDLDRDGRSDFMAGGNRGTVRVWSGRDGTSLLALSGGSFDGFGLSLARAGDVNADGWPDIVIGAPYGPYYAPVVPGYAQVFSGRDGRLLHTFTGESHRDQFGIAVSACGDLDRDGFADVVVGADQGQDLLAPGRGYVRAFSGRTGAALFTIWGDQPGDQLGRSVSGGEDLNLDGTPDFLACASQSSQYFQLGPGYMRAISGARLALRTDRHVISASAGGAQRFDLDVGLANAAQPFWVLGSMSGIRPGIRIGDLLVPLNADGYTTITVLFPNYPPLLGTMDRLDHLGRATAFFSVRPDAAASLVGLTIHHAFVLHGPAGLTFASNAVPLTFVQ